MKLKKIYNQIQSFSFNKKIHISISIFLVFLWLVLSLVFNKQDAFSVIRYGYNYESNGTSNLLKGNKILGEFVSKDNFLGIIYLRFNNFAKYDYAGADILQFRIREKGNKEFYYYNNYRTEALRETLLFPFGFPVIENSKDKTYQFELESLEGNENNSVRLSRLGTSLFSAHQYPSAEIQGSKKRLIKYFFLKTLTSITNLDFILSSLIFALPLFFYFLWIFIKSKLPSAKDIFPVCILILILIDIFVFRTLYLGIFISLIVLWITSIKINKLDNKMSFLMSFLLIIVWIFLTFINKTDYDSKLNIWAFSFLLIGISHLLLESMETSKESKHT